MSATVQPEPDLQFVPSDASRPLRRLSAEQVEQYNERGYLLPFRIFDADEMVAHRAYFDHLLEQFAAEGKDSYSINCYHHVFPGIYDLAKHPAIVDYARDLLGPDIICWATHYFAKMPGDGKRVSWHQDASYWPLRPAHTVTCWLALDDADPENGAMQFIPGTHTMGHLEYRPSTEDERNVLGQTITGTEDLGEPVYATLQAGEMSLHSDMLAHGSDPNLSDRRRCGLTLRYASADVRPTREGWMPAAIWVGEGEPDQHWATRAIARPEEPTAG